MKNTLDLGEDTKNFLAALFNNQLFDKLDTINQRLHRIEWAQKELKEFIMANHEAELAKIKGIEDKVVSVGQQIVAALAAQQVIIDELKVLVAAGADNSDINEALDRLTVSTQATDDLVDDLPVTIPPVV